MAEVHSGVVGLAGGPKQKWLREHRQEVLNYYNENGPEATMQRFRMKQFTFSNFLGKPAPDYQKFTKADRALCISEMAMDSAREANRKAAIVERQLSAMQPVIKLAYAFSAVMKMMETLPPENELKGESQALNISDFLGESEKRS